MPETLPASVRHMAAMRGQHAVVARRYAATIEKLARQITLETARDRSVADLLRQLAEYTHRLQGEQRAMDVIDEWAGRMRRAAQAA